MRRGHPFRFLPLALPVFLALAGCDGGEEPRRAALEPARMDTTNQGALDGLSAEQIRARAEAMSPERAEALGIIDTTIYVAELPEPFESIPKEAAGPPFAPDSVP